jgi:anion-transporting  ArsA/GET3 family ATPase
LIDPKDSKAIISELRRLSERLTTLEKAVAGKEDVARLMESIQTAQSEYATIEAQLVEQLTSSQEELATNIEKRFVIVERELNEIKRDQIDMINALQGRETGRRQRP